MYTQKYHLKLQINNGLRPNRRKSTSKSNVILLFFGQAHSAVGNAAARNFKTARASPRADRTAARIKPQLREYNEDGLRPQNIIWEPCANRAMGMSSFSGETKYVSGADIVVFGTPYIIHFSHEAFPGRITSSLVDTRLSARDSADNGLIVGHDWSACYIFRTNAFTADLPAVAQGSKQATEPAHLSRHLSR